VVGLQALVETAGTATVEFCLVFPIVLFLCLVLVQSTLLMVGNQFVHYAAFAATRSAIVYVPQDYAFEGEPRNVINPAQGRTKFDAIRAAAYLALVPVSGRLADSPESLRTSDYVSGLHDYFDSYGTQTPRWVDTLAADRLRYAAAHTDVTVWHSQVMGNDVQWFQIEPGQYYVFGPHDPITVHVRHKLNLSVPYVRALFADGEHPDGRGMYALVEAQYTLTNEGIDPTLPPAPELPRVTD